MSNINNDSPNNAEERLTKTRKLPRRDPKKRKGASDPAKHKGHMDMIHCYVNRPTQANCLVRTESDTDIAMALSQSLSV